MNKLLLAISLLFFCCNISAQITFSANDFVPPYNEDFGFGVNLGYFPGWKDHQLADLAAGNPDLNVTGIGSNSLRVSLPNWFIEQWGNEIRVDEFEHYTSLGMKNNVVFVAAPADQNRDSVMHCPGRLSESFHSLYEPIWDGGLNDTPVNEKNVYALYIYNLVLKYGDHTKYWEIYNEPDTDLEGYATARRGEPNNWWENDPPPCETKFGAPIQHYVRTLRVAYEVIKSVNPESYIAVGGIGNVSFLDAILRNTDNPDEGNKTAQFPLLGGAYFDCLSFHAYPHFDGSMRYWSDFFGGFQWTRNSDKAIEGFMARLDGMIDNMHDYGYTGEDGAFPEKNIICTETNLTRNALKDKHLGTEESQKNYIIKLMAKAQEKGISQVHFYSLADKETAEDADSDFDFMGLFESLEGNIPHQGKILEAGIAFKSGATALKGYRFDAVATKQLNTTIAVQGVAFKNESHDQIFVMWATALDDLSEEAEINYSFPNSFGFDKMKKFEWDFSISGAVDCISSGSVLLTGSPIFLIPNTSSKFNCTSGFVLKAMPNPFQDNFSIEIQTDIDEVLTADLIDANGKLLHRIMENQTVFIGKTVIPFEVKGLTAGLYFVSVQGKSGKKVLKMIK